VIADHHKKYPDEVYAPAWKTLEHMTFGAIFQLFLSIKDKEIQSAISRHYNVDKLTIFISYFNAIRYLRNQCAHGDVLFDMKLPTPMKSGPAGKFTSFTNSNIIGAIEVVKYFLRQISIHRHSEFCKRLDLLLDNVENDTIAEVLNDISGFDMNFA
jgi:abortive infection bacteriophage resistance protein